MKTKENLSIIKLIDNLYLILFATFPIALILGNFIINLYIFLFSISFLINFKENKIIFNNIFFYLIFFFFFFLFLNFFYFFFFFFISLLINVFFSLHPENSFPRAIKVLFVILFIFEIRRLIQRYEANYLRNVYKSWFLIFLIISFDIIFELSFGHNLIGNKSYMSSRVASFFGDELVVGAFYHGFVLFFLSYLTLRQSKNYILILSIILVLLLSFLIGERSNFIKLFISVTIFTALVIQLNYKLKLFTASMIFMLLAVALNYSSSQYKDRFYSEVKDIISLDGYSTFIKKS